MNTPTSPPIIKQFCCQGMENSAALLGAPWCWPGFGDVWLCGWCDSVCLASGWTWHGSKLCWVKAVTLFRLPAGRAELSAVAGGSGTGFSSPQEQHTALLCTPAGRLSQQQVNKHHLKGFKRKPSTQTGTGLGVQRENWNETQSGLRWPFSEVLKLICVAAVNWGEPQRNPEFHL